MKKYIYKIVNTINGKIYIGQTNNPKRREREHFSLCSSITEDEQNKILYKAMIKYGPQNFSFEIIENLCEDYNEKEKYWIKKLNTLIPNGYNMTEGGENPPVFHGEEHYMATHCWDEVYQIKKLLINTKISTKEIAKQFNYDTGSITKINRGQLWYEENLIYPLRKEDTHEFLKERSENIIYDLMFSTLSQKEIANKYGVGRTTVTAINRGQNYKQENINYPIRKNSTNWRPVMMIDKENKKVLKEFKTLAEAREYLKLPKRGDVNIGKCCRGEIQSAYGYIWKYID